MKEELLHYIWKYKLFYKTKLYTSDKTEIQIISVGTSNTNSGPDFFNAKIKIDEQLWAGNVEIHVKSSDWYVHHHQEDENYDNVILHVVWEDDIEIFNKENTAIHTLELKQYVSKSLLNNYKNLFSKPQKWINCQSSISLVDKFIVDNWVERLYVERLESKAGVIDKLLVKSKFNWEEVLFQLLAKNFGLKVNAEVFYNMALSIDFAVVKKERQNEFRLESLLFGRLNMLKENHEEVYFNNLKKEYQYQIKKYKLVEEFGVSVQYFRLRPINFPTIRISQFANLICKNKQLFSQFMELEKIDDFYDLFEVTTSKFWETHYTFGKESKKRIKKITKSFVDLVLINTIIPLKLVYLKHLGVSDTSGILNVIKQIKPEKNSIITKYAELKFPVKNALETQGLLQLKNEYCAPQKCLECAIGNSLLKN